MRQHCLFTEGGIREKNMPKVKNLLDEISNTIILPIKPEIKIYPEKHENNQNKFCLFLYSDILGYRNLLEQKGTEFLHDKILSSINSIKDIIDSENDSWEIFFGKENGIKFHIASDTIIIYFEIDNYNEIRYYFSEFIDICSMIYIELLFQHNIRLRGLISLTHDYKIEENLAYTFGNIAELYKSEKELKIIGIVIAIKNFPEFINIAFRPMDYCYILFNQKYSSKLEYQLPFINLFTYKTSSFMYYRGYSFGEIGYKLQRELVDKNTNKDVFFKLINTIEYFKKIISFIESEKLVKDYPDPTIELDQITLEWYQQ